MKTTRDEILPAKDDACKACPWLTKNHRKPHPEGYYTDANRRRLWSGLRTGEAPGMTCHPTDPQNQPVKESVATHECTGALVLMARELRCIEESLEGDGSIAGYQRGRKYALTREGIGELVNAMLPPPFGRGLAGQQINDDPEISLGLGTGR